MNVLVSGGGVDGKSKCWRCVLHDQRRLRRWKEEREEMLSYVVNELLTIKEEIADLIFQLNPFFVIPGATRDAVGSGGDDFFTLETIVDAYKKLLDTVTAQIPRRKVQFGFSHRVKEALAKDSLTGIRYALRYHVEELRLREELARRDDFIENFLATCELCKKPAAVETLMEKSRGKYLTELTYLADCCIYGLEKHGAIVNDGDDESPPSIGFNSSDTFTINCCGISTLDIFNL